MLDYDFAKLNDKEFEAFAIDLLGCYLGEKIERFKSGKDRGVDGRFFSCDGEVILQCKHWPKTGIAGLIRVIRDSEASKVAIINPARYIFITSLPLSRGNKASINELLSPFVLSESDIFGQDDLNQLLAIHKQVEERHYKLWFSSVTILSRLNNAAIKGRSDFKLAEAKFFASKYVVTASHNEAINKLEVLGTIIVTGDPGIGKSTLSEQIALQYALKGFQICCLADSIEEAEAVWENDTPQLFYFDDFLGRNFLEALGRHEDAHIIGFIKRVRNDGSKRFILTSRTTVLNSGKTLTELFRIENLDQNEYELRVNKLTLLDKARILYNHLWNSELTSSHIDQIYAEARYLDIARHQNFNPRLISFITDRTKLTDVLPDHYWRYIQNTLENPADVWAHVFSRQLNESSRTLVRLTVFNGKDMSEDELEEAFNRYTNTDSTPTIQKAHFDTALKLCIGAVLNRTVSSSTQNAHISLFNPSLGDYILNLYKKNLPELCACFTSLLSERSLFNLSSLKASGTISRETQTEVLFAIAEKALGDSQIALCVRLRIADMLSEEVTGKDLPPILTRFITDIFDDDENSVYPSIQADLLYYAIIRNILHKDCDQMSVKTQMLIENSSDEEDYIFVSKLIAEFSGVRRDALEAKFVTHYVDAWREGLENTIHQEGILNNFSYEDEIEEATHKVIRHVERYTNELHLNMPHHVIDDIVDACDVRSLIQANSGRIVRRYEGGYADGRGGSVTSDAACVHDLFERS